VKSKQGPQSLLVSQSKWDIRNSDIDAIYLINLHFPVGILKFELSDDIFSTCIPHLSKSCLSAAPADYSVKQFQLNGGSRQKRTLYCRKRERERDRERGSIYEKKVCLRNQLILAKMTGTTAIKMRAALKDSLLDHIWVSDVTVTVI
jgi:hypothetical protein